MSVTVVVYMLVGVLAILGFAVFITRLFDTEGKSLRMRVKQLIDDYFNAHAEQNLEKRRLLFERLTLATDRVLSLVLAHYGIKNSSVKEQLRSALERKIITYDQFQLVKRFHHMRNEVVHEGLQIAGSNEQFIYDAIVVIKSIIGT